MATIRVTYGLVCVLACLTAPAAQPQTGTETVLHNFANPSQQGTYANPCVVRDQSGNLYGTTLYGGTAGYGLVYKLQTTGQEKVLYNFTGGADGGNPSGSLALDAAGNLYGTTPYYGGTASAGVVFKIAPNGHETVLYTFTGGADGGNPMAGVTLDSAGNVYGTTFHGGTVGAGAVYKITPAGQETVLYSFTGGDDGSSPEAGVILDSAGNLYGTTYYGGSANAGVVYKVDTTGVQAVIYSFTGGADGANPAAGVILDSAGNLYGTTRYGGTQGSRTTYGVVYMIDPAGQETVLHSFGGSDGANPTAGVVMDSSGNLYGTAGVAYMLDTAGLETILYSFPGGANGSGANGGVILDSTGNLYGVAYGGVTSAGVLYELNAAGQQTVLFTFASTTDGSVTAGRLVSDSSGNLYGATSAGGIYAAGVVYKVNPAGKERVLYTFAGGSDGQYPSGGVTLDSAGNLYGTTFGGGANAVGVIYKIDTTGTETDLHSFTGGGFGANPTGGVVLDSAGNLYGAAGGGGPKNYGIVYKLYSNGHQMVLHAFSGGADGAQPNGPLVLDSAGNIYGTTLSGGTAGHGVVFKLDSKGNETILYTFTGGADGAQPNGGLSLNAAGTIYGTTYAGGTAGYGVVYKLNAKGRLTVLYSFTGGADGANACGGVVGDSAGNTYGTTCYGGTSNAGVVYELVAGQSGETVLYSFTGGNDGKDPEYGVILSSAGNLYGTTTAGGKHMAGVVYEVTP